MLNKPASASKWRDMERSLFLSYSFESSLLLSRLQKQCGWRVSWWRGRCDCEEMYQE